MSRCCGSSFGGSARRGANVDRINGIFAVNGVDRIENRRVNDCHHAGLHRNWRTCDLGRAD
jgi:hypothetical protein